jgi:hypothetical protein
MKKFLFLLLWGGIYLHAQTTINTSTVSGTWSLAGSPYLVQNNISVQGGQVLTIEPGVEVKFQPGTKCNVNGQLIAIGTNALPIIFKAIDTVGWSNDNVIAGGWNGIHYHQYLGGGTDLSTLQYCTVQDGKYGYNYAVMYANAFTSERGIKILNCTFQHNRSGFGLYVADPPMHITTYLSTDTIVVDGCEFYNNASVFGIIQNTNFAGGATRITNCHIHDNQGSGIYSNWNSLLIENCEINNNTMINDAGPIRLSLGKAVVRGNRIHHNQSDDYGGIACRAGKITIENNLICNNRQDDAFCGITGGGAGINLGHNEGSMPFDSTYYIVRNNIIANNYAAYGGGGLYVFNARAVVSNNHLINNYTPNQGNSIMIINPNSEVYMKNNLFHNQNGPGNIDSTQAVYILSAAKIQFDNNYIPAGFSKSVQAASGYTLIGDTLNNVIGMTPDMVNPTIDNNYLTSALTADFSLLSTSPCIDEGDTAGAHPGLGDYLGNFRIENIVDIGAFEYGSKGANLGIENMPGASLFNLLVYPNPALSGGSITLHTPCPSGEFILTDLTGKIVWKQQVYSEKNTLNLTVPQGMYILRFWGAKNGVARLLVE